MDSADNVTDITPVPGSAYSTGVNYPLPASHPVGRCTKAQLTSSCIMHSMKEHARLEEQSEYLADLMGCTNHATLPPSPRLLLDLGCGMGVVTTQLGNLYPNAQVYGIDLSPVPQVHQPPPNVKYIQGDLHALSRLDPRLTSGQADLAFGRLLVCGIWDWPACVAAMRDQVRPGGWVELQDLKNRLFDASGRRVDTEMEWMRVLRASLEAKGLDPDAGINAEGYLRQAGLVEIQSWEYKWTVGTWLADKEPRTRRFGEFEGREMKKPLAVLLEELPERSTYTHEQINVLKRQMLKDMKAHTEGESGMYFTFTVTIGGRALEN